MITNRAIQDKKNFLSISTGGILFQGGQATIDTGTIIAVFVYALTESPFAVGLAAAIAQLGWLFPQLFVAHAAADRRRRMGIYCLGAFGRAFFLFILAGFLWFGNELPKDSLIVGFFILWTAYAFTSGIVAVPYNDIVARVVHSDKRSRLLAVRFFGGGVLALMVSASAYRLLDPDYNLIFPSNFAIVFILGCVLLTGSAMAFSNAVEPPAPLSGKHSSFIIFVKTGFTVFQNDLKFRRFVIAQWLGGVTVMALPFYILQPGQLESAQPEDIALFLGIQTAGMLVLNPLWGNWGDHLGKFVLLKRVAALKGLAPILALLWLMFDIDGRNVTLAWFALIFFLLGGVGNGGIIAQLGYLMEISPDNNRPAYSGYFNMFMAPTALLPMFGAVLSGIFSFTTLFAISLMAAVLHFIVISRLGQSLLKSDDQ